MTNSTNITSDNVASCPNNAASIFFTATMAIIGSAAFIGNILVFITVYQTRSLRTSTNYYYVNMAVSDFLSSLATWPLYLTDDIIASSGTVLEGSVATFGCKVGVFSRLVSAIVSTLCLVLIATDRFVATVFPLKARIISRKVRAVLLLGTWLISIGYCYPMFHYSRVNEDGKATFCTFGLEASLHMIYYVSTGVILFEIIPLMVIIILYSRIMRALRQRLNPECNVTEGNVQQIRNKHSQNIMKIFKSIVIMLFVLFSVFGVYVILKVTSPELFVKDRCNWISAFAYYVVPLLSTATNPVILFSFSTNFRQALSQLCPFPFGRFRACCKAVKISSRQRGEFLPELTTFKRTTR